MSNLRLTTDRTVCLFDFGNALKTWRASELAIVFWSLGNRYNDIRERLWEAFLAGYESMRPLPSVLSSHLGVMLILRQIEFLGGNCATLPLRRGVESIETGFVDKVMGQIKKLVDESLGG